jgi:hypothetical protein
MRALVTVLALACGCAAQPPSVVRPAPPQTYFYGPEDVRYDEECSFKAGTPCTIPAR